MILYIENNIPLGMAFTWTKHYYTPQQRKIIDKGGIDGIMPFPAHYTYVIGLYVDENNRNRGIAKKIMEYIHNNIKGDRSKGEYIDGFTLYVEKDNKIAAKMYKKFGYKKKESFSAKSYNKDKKIYYDNIMNVLIKDIHPL
jgi:ribosomal protein S18 acetylase RimI-like enzyme